MPFEVKPLRAGVFSAKLDVFIDVGTLTRQKVSVRGTAVGEPEKE